MNKNMKIASFFVFIRALLTGFIGGFIWSTFAIFMHYFNFAEVDPKKFILRLWKNIEWTNGWLGGLVTVLILAILSIVVAFVFYLLFKKVYVFCVCGVFGIGVL